MEYSVFFLILIVLGWLYYRLQARIGEGQALEREDLKQRYRKQCSQDMEENKGGMTSEQQKTLIEGVWARYHAQQAINREQKENESKSNIRKK